jgi:excisionase family DNA binding protein
LIDFGSRYEPPFARRRKAGEGGQRAGNKISHFVKTCITIEALLGVQSEYEMLWLKLKFERELKTKQGSGRVKKFFLCCLALSLIVFNNLISNPTKRRFELESSERWLSVEEIADHLGVSKESIYRWLERQKIPAHRVGKLWKFKASEVDDWVKNGGSVDEPGSLKNRSDK